MPQMSPLNWIFIFFLTVFLCLYILPNLNKIKKENKMAANFKKINKKVEW